MPYICNKRSVVQDIIIWPVQVRIYLLPKDIVRLSYILFFAYLFEDTLLDNYTKGA